MKGIFVLMIVLAGCSAKTDKPVTKPHISKAESSLENIIDSFQTQYHSAASASSKEMLLTEYKETVEKFLSSHYLNHMHVHIDSVGMNRQTIQTRFDVNKKLVFSSSTEFHRHMSPKEDSLFQFMKNLKPCSDANIDFMYTGKFDLKRPDDTLQPVLVVSAYPLSYQVHGK